MHEVDQGSVLYDGRDFCAMSRKERIEIRKEIGMLFQGSALFDSLTVEENVIFPLRMFTDMSEEEMRERANFCLNRVNIINKNDLLPAETSGGMQKRIAIARAIAMNPRYLFCDEPNSGLDPVTSRLIDELLKSITEEFKITTIINTHDMKTVFDIGDDVVFIYEGNNEWSGKVKDIKTSGNEILTRFIEASQFH